MTRRFYRPADEHGHRGGDHGYAALAAAMVEVAVRDARCAPTPRFRSDMEPARLSTLRERSRIEAVEWLEGRLRGRISVYQRLDLLRMDHDALTGRMRSAGMLA
jgi:hypothetical protein